MAERACRWPFWRAWASSGLYVTVAVLPRSPSRQTFKHLFCVYDTEEEIKGPQGTMRKKKFKKPGVTLRACQARWGEKAGLGLVSG